MWWAAAASSGEDVTRRVAGADAPRSYHASYVSQRRSQSSAPLASTAFAHGTSVVDSPNTPRLTASPSHPPSPAYARNVQPAAAASVCSRKRNRRAIWSSAFGSSSSDSPRGHEKLSQNTISRSPLRTAGPAFAPPSSLRSRASASSSSSPRVPRSASGASPPGGGLLAADILLAGRGGASTAAAADARRQCEPSLLASPPSCGVPCSAPTPAGVAVATGDAPAISPAVSSPSTGPPLSPPSSPPPALPLSLLSPPSPSPPQFPPPQRKRSDAAGAPSFPGFAPSRDLALVGTSG
mmetsp:Transcript_10144/g.30245  ORF Transcript_10144/g.30245 Transcript_10144/m.30245 type:complete len:295 (-) Transcript_10144:177-1061(-)